MPSQRPAVRLARSDHPTKPDARTRRRTDCFCLANYGQIANDGRNVYVATRSIGEPEGGAAGYAVGYLHGEDFALAYRTVADRGPLVLITHTRRLVLCTGPGHIVSGPDECRVRVWSASPATAVQYRLDGGGWADLEPLRNGLDWRGALAGDRLAKGEHLLEVQATDSGQGIGGDRLNFQVDRSGRFTAVPQVEPPVKETRFC